MHNFGNMGYTNCKCRTSKNTVKNKCLQKCQTYKNTLKFKKLFSRRDFPNTREKGCFKLLTPYIKFCSLNKAEPVKF